MNKLYLFTISYFPGWTGGWVGWWLKFLLILRLSQPSLAGVGAGAELGNNNDNNIIDTIRCDSLV